METEPSSIENRPEPWMRDTWAGLDPLRRGVIHALELCQEDTERWAASLTDEQMFARPLGLPSSAFHLRHIARSLDRLLTYAEARSLTDAQLTLLRSEEDAGTAVEVIQEFRAGLKDAIHRVLAFAPEHYTASRGIGRKKLPTTVGGLLMHCAEHAQRHSGQMVTTVKAVLDLTSER